MSETTFLAVLQTLLDWPFLLFVLILVIVVGFRAQVRAMMGRGDIQISWGENQHIHLKDLSDGLDQEIDPIKEELQLLRDRVARLESGTADGPGMGPAALTRDAPHSQEDETGEDDGAAPATSPGAGTSAPAGGHPETHPIERKLMEELHHPRFRWRTIDILAARAATDPDTVLDILRPRPDVVIGMSKSKRRIARLKDR